MQPFVVLDTIKQDLGVIPVGWASTRASLGCSTVTHVLWVRPHEGILLLLRLGAMVSNILRDKSRQSEIPIIFSSLSKVI